MLALLNCCDCYVSLHRAEGLGLGMIEAMQLGKPVIASNYSGNCDFTTDQTSFLVPCTRVANPVASGPYPAGVIWGEPDLHEAARLMRRVHDQPEVAQAKAETGRKVAGELFSMSASAQRIASALVGTGKGA